MAFSAGLLLGLACWARLVVLTVQPVSSHSAILRLDSLSRAVLAHFEEKGEPWKSKTEGGSKPNKYFLRRQTNSMQHSIVSIAITPTCFGSSDRPKTCQNKP